MAEVYAIPLNKGNQTFSVDLGGRQFRVQVTFRDVECGGWYFDLIQNDSGVGLFGLPVLQGVDALEQFQYLGWGHISFAFDSGLPETPGYSEMGDKIKMLWSADGI